MSGSRRLLVSMIRTERRVEKREAQFNDSSPKQQLVKKALDRLRFTNSLSALVLTWLPNDAVQKPSLNDDGQ